MLNKKDIINLLFVLSFPVFGLGAFISGNASPSVGYVIAVVPEVLILIFWLIDSMYTRSFNFRPGAMYFLCVLFLSLASYSLYVAFANHIPFISKLTTMGKIAGTLIPFQAFIPVFIYNGKDVKKVLNLTFVSLSLLLAINLFGFFALGLKNAVHSIEGRINFPFIDSFYSGSGVLIILSFMLVYYMKKSHRQPLYFTSLLLYLVFNLILIFYINSRLQILIFLPVLLLMIFNVRLRSRILFFLSVFLVPILLASTLLVYEILSQPFFEAILVRTDMRDVMTFNGRSFLWQHAIDWLLNDQRGLWFGNGFRGQYVLRLVEDVAKAWGTESYHLHLHSTAFEILVSTGIVGYGLFLMIMYKTFVFLGKRFANDSAEGMVFPIFFFLIYVLQVDALVYLSSAGNVFLVLLWALVTVQARKSKDPVKVPDVLVTTSGPVNGNGAGVKSVNQY